jgi:hypothetical protein
MMLSKVLNSDTIFNSLKQVAEGPQLPQVTAITTPQINQPLLLVGTDKDTSTQQPPSKRARTSGQFLRVPCKARSIPNTHNSSNAFLNVPVDAPHGLLLSCSHFECAASGRTFRYCIVCATPVAKRNFPQRHGHGLIISAKDLKKVDCMCEFIGGASLDEDVICDDVSIGSRAGDMMQQQQKEESTFKGPRTRRRVVSFHATKYLRTVPQLPDAVATNNASQTLLAPSATTLIHNLSALEKEWLQLLEDRPDLEEQGSLMTIWMDKIISFSDEKGCALPKSRSTRTMAPPQHFASTSAVPPPPQEPRELNATAPLPEPIQLEKHQTTFDPSPWTAVQSVSRSSSSEADTKHFSRDMSEFAAALDNIDMTAFFD